MNSENHLKGIVTVSPKKVLESHHDPAVSRNAYGGGIAAKCQKATILKVHYILRIHNVLCRTCKMSYCES